MGNLTAVPTNTYVELWKVIYKGKPDWLDYNYPTLSGKIRKRTRKAFKGAKMVCSELCSLMYSEAPDLKASDDLLKILERSGWDKNIKQFSELCAALGGGAFKLYTRDGLLYIDYVPADRFIPVSWDSAGIYEADFLDRRIHNKKEFLRVEKHRKTDTGYNIKQEFYEMGKGEKKMLAPTTPFALGLEIDSDELVNGVDIITDKPLFSYVRLPEANNIDPEAPTGIAFFHNSTDTLEGLDVAFDALQSEITLGRKRIIVPAGAVRKVINVETDEPVRYFDPSDEVYQAFEANDNQDLKITDNSVELRIDELRMAVQTYLDILSVQCGFSAGYLTFDGQSGTKTATEIISENSKTHKTVINVENSFRDAILDIFDSIKAVEKIYKINIGEFDYVYQDNIHQDKDSITNYWLGRLNSNTITLETFLEKVDNLSEEDAKKKASEIREKSATGNVNDLFKVDL